MLEEKDVVLRELDLDKETVFLDQDETLLKHLLDPRAADPRLETISFELRGESCWYQVRPSTVGFLTRLSELGYQLAVVTSGSPEFQAEVLRQTGLLKFMSGVFGTDKYKVIPAPKAWVLVDDHQLYHPGLAEKCGMFGLPVYTDFYVFDGVKIPNNLKEGEELEKAIESNWVKCEGWWPNHYLNDDDVPVEKGTLTELIGIIQEKLQQQLA